LFLLLLELLELVAGGNKRKKKEAASEDGRMDITTVVSKRPVGPNTPAV
jgi:hypothetical protein